MRKKNYDYHDEVGSRSGANSVISTDVLKKIGRISLTDSEINPRAVMVTFQLVFGGRDVGRLVSMMYIRGGRSFERNFYRHSSTIVVDIRKMCTKIIEEAKKIQRLNN